MKLLKSSWKHQCSADGLFEKGWIVKGAVAGAGVEDENQ
jgi:hypothetical protein